MKRIIALLLVMLMMTMVSCGTDNNDNNTPEDQTDTQVTQDEETGDDEQAEPENQETGEETEEQDTENQTEPEDTQEPEDTDESGEDEVNEVKDNIVDPSEITPRGDEPPTGDDKSTRGIPDLIDVITYDDGDLLVLVNKYHGTVADYEPSDMVVMDNSLTTWENIKLKKVAYDAYLEMYNAAKAEGYDLKVCSGYRSYDGQQQLFNNALSSYDAAFAHMYSAYPGRSEHHTGLAIDITSASMGWGLRQDFADYPDGQWLYDHCQDYGFILRYTKGGEDITGYMYEPWHFRYVGKEDAKKIMEEGITLEEYLGKE